MDCIAGTGIQFLSFLVLTNLYIAGHVCPNVFQNPPLSVVPSASIYYSS